MIIEIETDFLLELKRFIHSKIYALKLIKDEGLVSK